jgi:hypothetical protein
VSNQNPKMLMYEILQLHDEVNHIASHLNKDAREVFGKISLGNPVFNPPELGFMRAVSWLFVVYYEVGRVNVEFLNERLASYNLDIDGKNNLHFQTIQQLRTYLQHNLDASKPHDRRIQANCGAWFHHYCGTHVPKDGKQWKICLMSLLKEAHSFLNALKNCIRCIEQDESREYILYEWNLRHTRTHPPYEFDRLILIVASDMGRDNIDAERLRKRFYNKWLEELRLLQGDYKFEVEARKLIEHVLLTEVTSVLPITGDDIIKEFNIRPGKQVGVLLQKARMYYDAGVHLHHDLIEKLREEYSLTTDESTLYRIHDHD